GGRPVAQAGGAAAPRILYSSDWSGTFQIYAVDPTRSGRIGQLTFDPAPACRPGAPGGDVAPIPSPDGTKGLCRAGDVAKDTVSVRLFAARAAGSGRRRLLTVNHFDPPATSWSPDSRRIAYADRDGIRVVGAAGGASRLVLAKEGLLFGDLSWSPSGA